MDQRIAFEHEQVVHLEAGTYHWVSLKQFRIDPTMHDRELRDWLTAHWHYHDHYAGEDGAEQDYHSLHGPYRLECITADAFHPQVLRRGGTAGHLRDRATYDCM